MNLFHLKYAFYILCAKTYASITFECHQSFVNAEKYLQVEHTQCTAERNSDQLQCTEGHALE